MGTVNLGSGIMGTVNLGSGTSGVPIVIRDGHAYGTVTRPDGSTSTLDLGDLDAVVDCRWDQLTVMATRFEHGPITRWTYYALGARAYADVVDRGWPVW